MLSSPFFTMIVDTSIDGESDITCSKGDRTSSDEVVVRMIVNVHLCWFSMLEGIYVWIMEQKKKKKKEKKNESVTVTWRGNKKVLVVSPLTFYSREGREIDQSGEELLALALALRYNSWMVSSSSLRVLC